MLKINNEILINDAIYVKTTILTTTNDGVKTSKEVFDVYVKATDEDGKETLLCIETRLGAGDYKKMKTNEEIDVSNQIDGVLFWYKIDSSIRIDNVQILDVGKVIAKINVLDEKNMLVNISISEINLLFEGILKT